MIEFRLFGIPVRVEWTFWLVMGILAYMMTGKASMMTGKASLSQQQLWVLLGLITFGGFLSVLVHELGHALVGKWLGGGSSRIVLHGLGGYAQFLWGELPRWKHVIMVAGGPGFQLALGFLCLYGVLPFLPVTTPPLLLVSLYSLAHISIFWALINLIPVFPLDGGQIMAGFLGPAKKMLTHQISLGVAIVAAPVFIYLAPNFPIFGIIMGFLAWQNWQQVQGGRF